MKDEFAAYGICMILIIAICSTAIYTDSNGTIPECQLLSATVQSKVHPIPNMSVELYGLILSVDDQVTDEFDGMYYVIVTNSTYNQYSVNETYVEYICTAEDYLKMKELLYYLISLEYITKS